MLLLGYTSCIRNNSNTMVTTESKVDSIDIPRTHLGITLGQSYNDAMNILNQIGEYTKYARGGVGAAYINKTYPRIKSVAFDIKNNEDYQACGISCIDNEIYEITVGLPSPHFLKIKEKTYSKYPFEIEDTKYHVVGNGGGYVSASSIKKFIYSNGITDIEMYDGGPDCSYVYYYDSKLRQKARNHMEEIDARAEAELESKISNF